MMLASKHQNVLYIYVISTSYTCEQVACTKLWKCIYGILFFFFGKKMYLWYLLVSSLKGYGHFTLIHYLSFIKMRPTYISTICERFSQEYGQNQSLNVMQIEV